MRQTHEIFQPDVEISKLEKRLFVEMEAVLERAGFQYLSIPSLVTKETYLRQNTIPWENVFRVNDNLALAGSAEQGILQRFTGQKVQPAFYYAHNQCFRNEKNIEKLKRLFEFKKTEMFSFCRPEDSEKTFELFLGLVTSFYKDYDIEYKVVDVTKEGQTEGYCEKKCDIEIYTETYGWLEANSCTLFGKQQVKRFNIIGDLETVSNTAIASPRILIPFLERLKKT